MIHRRDLMLGAGTLGLFVAVGCAPAPAPAPAPGPAGPGLVTVQATGAAGMNPGPDGGDRPLTLTVVQLKGTEAFQGADFFALQSPATALGADLVSEGRIALAPGGSGSLALELDPSTTAIGLVGGYRDPAGKTFRVVAPVQPGTNATLVVNVTGSGLTVAPS